MADPFAAKREAMREEFFAKLFLLGDIASASALRSADSASRLGGDEFLPIDIWGFPGG